jgi:predicted AlkP superfamily pyrophosphatase or phosphodiesterase
MSLRPLCNLLVLWLVVVAGSHTALAAPPEAKPTRDVVVWVSMDGFRSDYLKKAETPNLNRLIATGVSSLELEPIFPSITFPSHISQATGVRVARHGIPSNTFYDSAADFTHRYPWYGRLLEAEPIWLTAARQNVRVASLDWPLSHSQSGKVTATYFEERFDGSKTDAERLDRLLDVWQKDKGKADEPLRLLMSYVVGTDTVGHVNGPDSHEVIETAKELDTLIGSFVERIVKTFDDQRQGDEQLYLLLTTDHGMLPTHTAVHLGNLANVEGMEGVNLSTGGNVGDIFFAKNMPDRDAVIEAALTEIRKQDFAKAWKREDLPKEWELAHPTRVGDIVVVLERGYTFNRSPKDKITASTAERGPRGMHGYDPKHHPEMLGPMIVWRHPKPLPTRQLGRVSALQLHPTVAKLLGIQPSDMAKEKPIELEEAAK